jgi:hypothetical protein
MMDAIHPNLRKIHEPAEGARLLVLLAIMPHNDSFSMGNQANLLLSHLLSTIKPPSSPFTLGTYATSFC